MDSASEQEDHQQLVATDENLDHDTDEKAVHYADEAVEQDEDEAAERPEGGAAEAPENNTGSNLSAEEEEVWQRLCTEVNNRMSTYNHKPHNIWTASESELVQGVSDAGLKEMHGRLLTLLTGVEYSLSDRGHAVHCKHSSGSAHGAHHKVSSRHSPDGQGAASQASQATGASTPGARRRVINSEGEMVRSCTSAGDVTPAKGARTHDQPGTPHTGYSAPHAASTVGYTPANSQVRGHGKGGSQTPVPQQPYSERASARGGPGGVATRGYAMSSVSPGSTYGHHTVALSERPPFDLNFKHTYPQARNATYSHGGRAAPTPRTVRSNLNDTPEPLSTVPSALQAKRQKSVNNRRGARH